HHGHFEYKVVPYGVTGGPATFQRVMNWVIAPLLRVCVIVFIDDILVYSKTWEQHLEHVAAVFQLLHEHQFKIKLSKCSFAKQELPYLGHIISAEGVATDPGKVKIIQNWPVPISVKELCSFLGMTGYYRKFVQHFGVIAKPLTNLLKKNELFVWTTIHQEAFKTLQNALISAPVLAMPDFSQKFIIETDASANGINWCCFTAKWA